MHQGQACTQMSTNTTNTTKSTRPLKPIPPSSSMHNSSYTDRRLPNSLLLSSPDAAPTQRVLNFDSSKVESPFLDAAVLERRRRDAGVYEQRDAAGGMR